LEAWAPPVIERPPTQFRMKEFPATNKNKPSKKDRQDTVAKQPSDTPRPKSRKAKKQQQPVKKTSSKPALPSQTNGVKSAGTSITNVQSRKFPREGHRRSRNRKIWVD
ncbi:MAG TPA: hypothetical protein VGF75_00945, partial [Candidatus Saccharimonadales bacterium]